MLNTAMISVRFIGRFLLFLFLQKHFCLKFFIKLPHTAKCETYASVVLTPRIDATTRAKEKAVSAVGITLRPRPISSYPALNFQAPGGATHATESTTPTVDVISPNSSSIVRSILTTSA
jgi:hypothetical protein